MRFGITTLTLLLVCGIAQAQSCATYNRSYTPTYSYAPAVTYGTPTYYAPAKVYKETYKEDYYQPAVLRFILALPVANLPSYGAAYADPHALAPAPQSQAPPAKATGQESQMQQILTSQTQILAALKSLDDRTRAVEQRLEKIERTREPFKAQPKQQEEQGPPPKEEPASVLKIKERFIAVNNASCVACHSRSNAAKHGSGFVFSEDDGSINESLTFEQLAKVDDEIAGGRMPMTKTTHALKSGTVALTQGSADDLFRGMDLLKRSILAKQKLAAKRKEAAAE